MGSKVPPKSAIRRPLAVFPPRAAVVLEFKFPPRPLRSLRARSFSHLFAGRVRRIVIVFAVEGSFAFLRRLRRRKPLQCVGHATHKLLDAFAGSRRDSVKIELAFGAMLAQPFQP